METLLLQRNCHCTLSLYSYSAWKISQERECSFLPGSLDARAFAWWGQMVDDVLLDTGTLWYQFSALCYLCVLLFNLCQFSLPVSACIRAIRGQNFRVFRVFRGYIFRMNWRRWIPLMIVVAGIVTYHNSLWGQFIFDDKRVIQDNFRIKQLWPLSETVAGTSRPMVQLSLALNYAMGELNPWGYHLFNLVVHLLAGLTLYGVVKRTLVRLSRASELQSFRALETTDIVGQALRLAKSSDGEPAAGGAPTLQLMDGTEGREQARGYNKDTAATLAGIIALIWVVHPLNTQAVTYIIQRGESMMGLFYLITLYCFIRGANTDDRRPGIGGTCSVTSSATGDVVGQAHRLAGRVEDEPAAGGAPALQNPEAKKPRRSTAIQSSVHSPQSTVHSRRHSRAIWHCAAIAASAAGMLCKEVMVTAPMMVLFYDRLFIAGSWRSMLRQRAWFHLVLFATCAIPLVLSARSLTEGVSAGFGIKALNPSQFALSQTGVILHYLHLAIWPADLCFDYMWPVADGFWQIVPPLLVIMGLLVLMLWLFLRSDALAFPALWFFGILSITSSFMPILDLAVEHRMYLPVIAPIAVMVIASSHLFRQVGRWLQISSLTGNMVAIIIMCFVMVVLATLTVDRNRDYHTEHELWLKTVAQRPTNSRAYSTIAYHLIGQHKYAEAIELCKLVIAYDPQYAATYPKLAYAYLQIGRSDEAVRVLNKAIALDADFADGHFTMGLVRQGQQRFDEAVDLYVKAIKLDSHQPRYYHNLGLALMNLQRYQDAEKAFQSAVHLKPHDVQSSHALGYVQAKQGKYRDATVMWHHALDLNPAFWPSACQLAWIYATCPDDSVRDGHEALRLVLEMMAVHREPNAVTLEILAAAHAEIGQFDQAIDAAEQMQNLPVIPGTTIIPSTGRAERLASYRAGKAWRMRATSTE
jgi:Flp pilus assembly protein TadD